jgi:dolichol kinase
MNTTTSVVLASLLFLAVVSVSLSLNVLFRGKIYRWLEPESRPRRWVLISSLLLFAVFTIWFPVWMTWPQSLIAKALTLTFAIVFSVVGLTLKWFNRVVDSYVQRKGWPLR